MTPLTPLSDPKRYVRDRPLMMWLVVCMTIVYMALLASGCKTRYADAPRAIVLPRDSSLVQMVIDCPGSKLPPIIRSLESRTTPGLETSIYRRGDTLLAATHTARSRPDTVWITVPRAAPPEPRAVKAPAITRWQRFRMHTGDVALIALAIVVGIKLKRLKLI